MSEETRGIICVGAKPTCYAVLWSYGAICVGCGCCGPPSRERDEARLKYWRWWLEEQTGFDAWADDATLRATQEGNVAANLRQARRRVRYYERRILRREGEP